MPAESGHGETGYNRRDQVAGEPRQRQRPPQAASRPVPSAWRGLTIRAPGRMRAPGSSSMFPEVAACDAPARARSMLSPLGPCAAELAAVVSVAASPNAIARLDPIPAVAGAGPDAGSRANADDRFGQPVSRQLEGPDFGEQAGGGGPPAGVLGQAALDQRPDFGRHLIKAGGAVDHAVQQRGRGPGAERALARAGEGQDAPSRRTRGAFNSPTGSAVSSSGSSATSGAAAPPGRFSEIQVSMRSHQSYSHWSWVS